MCGMDPEWDRLWFMVRLHASLFSTVPGSWAQVGKEQRRRRRTTAVLQLIVRHYSAQAEAQAGLGKV